jgi:hypothetical protein
MENEDRLIKSIEHLQNKVDTLSTENFELKRINRDLNSRINLLLNDNNIIKNVKLDMKDYSDFTQLHTEDTLREFFYLLVLSEKMSYLNNDMIWGVDAIELFTEAQSIDLPFYEWQNFIQKKLQNLYVPRGNNFNTGVPIKNSSCSLFEKLK